MCGLNFRTLDVNAIVFLLLMHQIICDIVVVYLCLGQLPLIDVDCMSMQSTPIFHLVNGPFTLITTPGSIPCSCWCPDRHFLTTLHHPGLSM